MAQKTHSRRGRRVAFASTLAMAMAVGSAPAVLADVQAPLTPSHDTVVTTWNQETVKATENASNGLTRPTVGSRYFAIVHTCMFDAWAAYDKYAVGTELGGTLRRPSWDRTYARKREAVSYAAHQALVDLFPSQKATFDAVLTSFGYNPANTSTDVTKPAGIAHVACGEVLKTRHNDGTNQLGTPAYSDPNPSYTAVNPAQDFANFDETKIVDPDRWTPLINNGVTQTFVTPHWGTTKPYALTDPMTYLPPPPPAYGSAQVTAAIDELVYYNANLTDERKVISEFWFEARESPTGHQNQWAQYVSKRDGNNIDEDVKMFFALNLAMGDSGVTSWLAKRHFDYARPITLIRYDKAGQQIQGWAGPNQGTATIDGRQWRSYLGTPSFPAYVSGHSTWGATAAEMLKLWTGSDYYGESFVYKAGTSKIEPGVTPATDITLSWPTFTSAAEQDGISRVYAGVHWDFDTIEGQAQGRRVAQNAWAKYQTYVNGTA